jgi:phosphate acetyltransferase
MEMLFRTIDKVGFFRPIITVKPASKQRDDDINLIATHFNLEIPYDQMYGYTAEEASTLISHGKEEELLDGIISKYTRLKKHYEFILCEGTDFASSTAAFEFDINAEISKNLGAPVLLVANAHQKTLDETVRSIELALDSLGEKGCHLIGTIVNRPDPKDNTAIIKLLNEKGVAKDQLIYTMPNEAFLGKPTVREIADFLEAEVLFGEDQLHRHVHGITVAAMQLRHFLTRLSSGSLVITPGDRADVIISCLAAMASKSIENISGILLSGDLKPEEPIRRLIEGFPISVPILSYKEDTFPTTTKIDRIHAKIAPHDEQKITRALALFEHHVDMEQLGERVITTRTSFVTPKMFEYELLQRARAHKQHIVLPEGEDERILQAADALLRRDVVDITLLGNEEVIREKIVQLELHMETVNMIDPVKSEIFDDYVQTYYELRQHKGITIDYARDLMCESSFFGTMMVYKHHADGMVSGAIHSTADTVRPALQIIKTRPGFSVVSSVFFMCLNKVLVYGDCAVNPNPNARQLAEIALSSAHTAKAFGVDPVVALLSYSTGESGQGEDVEKVREATKLAKDMAQELFPGLKLEGPIQYDAAIDPSVARTKLPDSDVAGKATVFVFPDLNTGNNTYKAVQRSAGAVAIGPVLQGLKYPVNDLSRGCSVPDIVNTVAITAIQAQTEKKR